MYCLDTQKHHPDYWQLRGMPGKETASVGNGAQEVEPQHGVPGHLTGSGGNGKPVYTEEKVPERYVIGCSGDMEEVNRRWKETYKWRRENKVDEIIDTPQPHFHQCSQVFPVYLHGRSLKGMPIMWDLIGKVNLPKADEMKLDFSLLTQYYVFVTECIWRVVLDKGEDDEDLAQFITVEDVGGVRPWHLTPRVLKVLRSLTGTMKANYMERMTITRSGRISQLLGKARNMKRLVRKRTHAVEHEAWKLALNSRELKESHKRIAFIPQHQLQQQQHVQKLLANGLRLLQLEHELKHLEEQDEVLDKQENHLEAANKGVADMHVEEEGWIYPGIPLHVEVEEIWEWLSSILDSRKALLAKYHVHFLNCRYDRQYLWKFAAKVQRQLGERIVLPMTDLRS